MFFERRSCSASGSHFRRPDHKKRRRLHSRFRSVVPARASFLVRNFSQLGVRPASTRREYFARSIGAIIQEMTGANTKLATMTNGRSSVAYSDKLGMERTAVAPIPKRTEATIMLNNKEIDILIDIGTIRVHAVLCWHNQQRCCG